MTILISDIRLDYGGACGLMPDGCGIYRVIDPGKTSLASGAHVGLHSRIYGCALARDGSNIDPTPTFQGPCAHGLTAHE
jgi:hypothetical protein